MFVIFHNKDQQIVVSDVSAYGIFKHKLKLTKQFIRAYIVL